MHSRGREGSGFVFQTVFGFVLFFGSAAVVAEGLPAAALPAACAGRWSRLRWEVDTRGLLLLAEGVGEVAMLGACELVCASNYKPRSTYSATTTTTTNVCNTFFRRS